LVNPLRKPGERNSYDVIFTSPTFNSNGTYRTNPRLTVMVNGILVQNNAIIYGGTNDDKIIEKLTGPILLQNHGCIVNYRNAWIREL
jgi:16S rRNA G966 N2-methylase RsmD